MAIATIYRGIEYRSRLEARWAAFFDHLGWNFTYEPFDGDGYIPDFVIHGDHPLLIEVKPATTQAEYEAPISKVTAGVREHWHHDILIVGLSPLTTSVPTSWDPRLCAGLLGEGLWPDGDGWATSPGGSGWDFAAAMWTSCGACGTAAVHHDYQSYACRPCGHHDGDHYLSGIDPEWIKSAWADACNDAKWRGRDAHSRPPVEGLIRDLTPAHELTVVHDISHWIPLEDA